MADSHEAIHAWFGLSYANYLVLPRAVLQSMSDSWQTNFVTLLEELDDAFGHLNYGAGYEVRALARPPEWIAPECPECEGEGTILNEDAGTEEDCPSCEGTGEIYDERRRETAEEVGFVIDPIPHYDRGRTRLKPRGLKRIRAGLYEHPSGTLITYTRDLTRWQHAQRDQRGEVVVAGSCLRYRTLREAAAALDGTRGHGR